ncbi:MAG: hypothetical protein DWC10_02910 [Candidatus Poseidoniales archaeon]|nr:MAG: hypothetical protein DWC10_02910 [Candidatus Poseidoniales archaeon]
MLGFPEQKFYARFNTLLDMFVAIFTNTVVALEADSEVGVNTELRRLQAKMDAMMEHLGMEYNEGE